jgi:ABC-type bacteriocin/lantibiotic exporter with double-glycine peptidase domain
MANFYTDSHGERWGVMIQEKKMSCGPACVAMTEVYSKSRVDANMEQIARAISQKYEGRFQEDTGSSLSNLASILRERGVPCYDAYNFGGGAVWSYLYAYAKDATPAICHVQWAKGAHFVVCIKVYKDNHRCVFLDPFYGLVEVVGSKLPTYVVQDPTGTFPPVATGKLSGWLLVTKASK